MFLLATLIGWTIALPVTALFLWGIYGSVPLDRFANMAAASLVVTLLIGFIGEVTEIWRESDNEA